MFKLFFFRQVFQVQRERSILIFFLSWQPNILPRRWSRDHWHRPKAFGFWISCLKRLRKGQSKNFYFWGMFYLLSNTSIQFRNFFIKSLFGLFKSSDIVCDSFLLFIEEFDSLIVLSNIVVVVFLKVSS